MSINNESINTALENSNRSNKCLRISHVNVENLIVHRDNFLSFFNDSSYDIIGISETFLKPILPSQPYNLNNYHLIRHDRENKEGGGVAVYLRQTFSYKVLATSQASYCKKPEYIILEISSGWKLLLCIVYSPPKVGHIDEFFQKVGDLIPLYDHLVILGDFNVNLHGNRVFPEKTQFMNLVDSLNLNIVPLLPTYHLPNSDTWLDLIIVKDLATVKDSGQSAISGLSYHDLIFVQLNLKLRASIKKDYINVRDFKNVDITKLKSECSLINWENLFAATNINIKVNIFCNKLLLLYDSYVPERRIFTNKNPCPWITENLRILMKQRNNLYKRYVRTKDPVTWENYRVLRNDVKRRIRDARNKHFEDTFNSDLSSKVLWKVVKAQGAGKESKKLLDPVVDLDSLNGFFCGIDNTIDNTLIQHYNSLREPNLEVDLCFYFNEVNADSVFKAISQITSNSIGSDGIHIKFLRLIFDEIKYVLCHLFNFSLANSIYPDQWKMSLILPLPKVPDPSDYKHYRPINILCVLGKIFDKLVFQQVRSFVCNNSILYKYQSGYRPNFSSQTALVSITDDVRRAMDSRELTVMILLDFSRAFDSVHHELLLSILRSYNFSNNVVSWFGSYLNNRQQRIKTSNGVFSEWKCNSVGVPQGSTLSAMLFSLYVNRICDSLVFSKSMLYADDLQLYVHCSVNGVVDAVNCLNADLNTLLHWCIDHGLKLNIAKCKPIILGTRRLLSTLNQEHIPKLIIDNSQLAFENSVKNLGLRIMKNLSWSDQVDYIHKRVFQCLYQFRRLSFNPQERVRRMLVSSLVLPLFDYACVAFCDLNKTNLNKLQRAQNACIRFIFKLRLDQHVTEFYKRLGILKIKERLEYNILSLAYKTLKRQEPIYLFKKYNIMKNIHLRLTRFGETTLQFPRHRTVIYTNSFHCQSIRLLNSLENNVKNVNSEKLFLKKLKSNLLNRYN